MSLQKNNATVVILISINPVSECFCFVLWHPGLPVGENTAYWSQQTNWQRSQILLDLTWSEKLYDQRNIKGIGHTKMKILSLITHPHVVPNPQIKMFLMESESSLTLPQTARILTPSASRNIARTWTTNPLKHRYIKGALSDFWKTFLTTVSKNTLAANQH